MTIHTRAGGIEIVVPDHLRIEDPGAMTPKARGPRKALPQGPIPLPHTGGSDLSDPVIAAMVDQDLALVDTFVISPTPSPKRRAEPERSRLTIDLDESEDSAILFEQDGLYSWRYPESAEAVAPPTQRRGPLHERPRRRVMFDLSVEPAPEPAARRKRGPITDFVVDKVRVYVFRFVARLATGSVIDFLERKKRTGLVQIGSVDLSQWVPIERLDALTLPTDRPARILLLVHGTFSSTLGSFGALGISPSGQDFLGHARQVYDAVIGYDHCTLSRDPLQNAQDLLGRLEHTTARSLDIDSVAFSRGGLVLRSLVEHLLPAASLRARVRRAVFVGATNGGTQLAVQENWARLIDLSTNLVGIGCKALSAFAPAAVGATIVRESVDTLGALVKCLAAEALSQEAVPGLASMVPAGRFITEINKTQPGQPGPAESLYYAISSDFDVQGISSGEEGRAPEFPVRLARWIVDAIADAAMQEPNDLVVNTSSVTTIDPEAGAFIKDRLHFERNPHVYHTVYFTRDEVVRAMARWLDFDPFAAEAVGMGVPAGADDRIMIVGIDEPFEVVLRAVRRGTPNFVIAQRDTSWGERYHYAYRCEELIDLSERLTRPGLKRSLEEVVRGTPLEMHESTSTPEATPESLGTVNLRSGPTGQRVIVRSGGQMRAVIERLAVQQPGQKMRIPGGTPRARASKPSSPIPASRRTRSARRGGEPQPGIPSPVATVGRGTVFVSGEMPESIPLDVVVPLTVVISQTELVVTVGPTRTSAKATVAFDRRIVLLVIPKKNLVVEGEDRFEVDPTVPRTDLVFDVKGVTAGDGEIWVILRQGPVALATLKLTPAVVAGTVQPSATRLQDAVNATEADPQTAAYPVLQIFEEQNGASFKYHFLLQPAPSKFVDGRSGDIKRPRGEYVEQMYKDIENRWLSTREDFDAFQDELRAFGGTLLDELVPPNIQAALWEVRNTIKSIQVVAEEPFIPWELVHLKPPRAADGKPVPLPDETHFLAQKGLVRWLHNKGAAPLTLNVRKGRSFYLVPDYPHPDYKLPAAQEEIPFLQKMIGGKPVKPDVTAIRDLMRIPGTVDHFHFSGHGEAEAQKAVDAQLMLSGTIESGNQWVPRYLKADFIAQNARLEGQDGAKPIVVLNACQVGRAGWRLSSIGGFAESFISAGAGIFVGSLWSVGDEPAHDFSEAFYRALSKGKTLANAAMLGREAARRAKEGSWLAYVVYGYPYAKVTIEKP